MSRACRASLACVVAAGVAPTWRQGVSLADYRGHAWLPRKALNMGVGRVVKISQGWKGNRGPIQCCPGLI